VPFTNTAIDQALDALNGGSPTSIIAYASLHSAYSTTGANELTGGSPAYAREAVTWAAAATGSKTSSAVAAAFNVPSGSTVAFVGLWSAATGGTFAGMGPAGAGTQYAFTAATSGNLFTAPGSAYANGATLVLFPGLGGTMPGGFVAGTIYYVISASGATFELSATSGGSAISVTAAGSGIVQSVTPEVYGAQGAYTLSSESLSFV
jgi:hypothetical protein